MSAPSVAIVILNWNGQTFLQQFLPSVMATSYPGRRVIVADNGSTDNSIAYLKEYFPEVELIVLDRNHGFAKGYNEALKQVSADYFVLLNSDVEVQPGWLEPMIALLEQDGKNAACQPKILSFHNRNMFEYAGGAGGWIDEYGYPFARGRVFDTCEEDRGQYPTREIFWASGAALVIKARLFQEAGGFDGWLWAHQEEIDLCWRLQLGGYKIFCCVASVVYHVGGGTLPRGNSRKTFLNFRNNQIILAKNLPAAEKWWKIPYRMLLDQVSGLRALFSGDAGYFFAVAKAHLAFLYWCLAAKRQRTAHKRTWQGLSGVYFGNLVWQSFVKKKKYFREIVDES